MAPPSDAWSCVSEMQHIFIFPRESKSLFLFYHKNMVRERSGVLHSLLGMKITVHITIECVLQSGKYSRLARFHDGTGKVNFLLNTLHISEHMF